MKNNLLSFDETARILDISRTALYDLMKKGSAPKYEKIGNHTVFDAPSVIRLKVKRQKEGGIINVD